MSGWPRLKLGEVLVLEYGKPLAGDQRSSQGKYPAYGANGVKAKTNEYLVDGESIIVGRKGSAGELARVSGRWWPLDVTYYVSTQMESVDIEYLYFAMQSLNLPSLARGVKPGINRNDVYALEIPLPPLDEQKRIVAKLDQVHHQLESLTKNLDLQKTATSDLGRSTVQEQLRTGQYLESVSRPSSPDNFRPLEPLEDNWEPVEIGSVCKVDWGNTKLTKRAYVEGGKYLAVSATGGDGRIDHAEHLANTPVLSAIGANCGRMFLPKEKFTAIKNTITLTPEDGLISGEFLFHLMQSVQLPIRGAGQPFISKGDIQKFLIALPPRDQQERIVKRIEEVQGELEVLQEKLAKRVSLIARFRVQVLSTAFSGEF